MSAKQINTQEKTEASLELMLGLVVRHESAEDATAALQQRLGPEWTSAKAMEWLTGAEAKACIDAMPDDGKLAGLTKFFAQQMVGVAADMCEGGAA